MSIQPPVGILKKAVPSLYKAKGTKGIVPKTMVTVVAVKGSYLVIIFFPMTVNIAQRIAARRIQISRLENLVNGEKVLGLSQFATMQIMPKRDAEAPTIFLKLILS